MGLFGALLSGDCYWCPFFPAGCHLAVRGYDVLVSAGVVQQSQHVAAIHLEKRGRALQLSVMVETTNQFIYIYIMMFRSSLQMGRLSILGHRAVSSVWHFISPQVTSDPTGGSC